MRSSQPKTIRQAFYRNIFVSLFFMLIILVFTTGIFVARFNHEQTKNYWVSYAGIFANEVKYPLLLRSTAELEKITHNFIDGNNVLAAYVLDSDGQPIGTPESRPLNCARTKESIFIDLFPTKYGSFCVSHGIYQTVNKIENVVADKKVGEVVLVISKQGIAALMAKIWLTLALLVIILLSGAFLIITKYSAFLTGTIEQMIEALKGFKNNQPYNRVTFSGSNDLDQMRDTFNTMLDNIERHQEIMEQAVILKTKELNHALKGSRAANQYKTNIMSTVSHEMKNPLHSILAGIELLFEALPRSSSERTTLEEHYLRSKALVHDLVRHIDAILFNAKLNANEYQTHYSTFLISEFIEECKRIKISDCSKNKNTMALYGNPSLTINTDRQLLKYIVDNLLDNACKFTRKGSISISWHSKPNEWTIEVQDTGVGMDKSDIAFIFEEFRQLDMSQSRKYSGFGLGLAIARQSARLLGGDIRVKSDPGKGSLFSLVLPNLTLINQDPT